MWELLVDGSLCATYMFEDVAHPHVQRLACHWRIFLEELGICLLPKIAELGLHLEYLGLPSCVSPWRYGICCFAAELLGGLGEVGCMDHHASH